MRGGLAGAAICVDSTVGIGGASAGFTAAACRARAASTLARESRLDIGTGAGFVILCRGALGAELLEASGANEASGFVTAAGVPDVGANMRSGGLYRPHRARTSESVKGSGMGAGPGPVPMMTAMMVSL